jgi:hypothetical protein
MESPRPGPSGPRIFYCRIGIPNTTLNKTLLSFVNGSKWLKTSHLELLLNQKIIMAKEAGLTLIQATYLKDTRVTTSRPSGFKLFNHHKITRQ